VCHKNFNTYSRFQRFEIQTKKWFLHEARKAKQVLGIVGCNNFFAFDCFDFARVHSSIAGTVFFVVGAWRNNCFVKPLFHCKHFS